MGKDKKCNLMFKYDSSIFFRIRLFFDIYFRILIVEFYGIINEMRDVYYEVDLILFNFVFV